MTDWSQDEHRECRIDELTRHDSGLRIRVPRPPGGQSARTIIFGKLISVTEEDYWRGNMRQQGYALTVDFPGRFGTNNAETFGPYPGHTRVKLEGKWLHRPAPWESDPDDWETPTDPSNHD